MQQVATVTELEATTFSGRRFTREQLEQVIETVATFKNLSRNELALTLCENFSWRNHGDALKVNSCLALLEGLEARGLVTLPAKRETKKPKSRRVIVSEASESRPAVKCLLGDVGPIEIQLASTGDDQRLFNELIERHHYLGYRQPVGQSLRYFIVAKTSDERLGCFLFAPAVFGMKARDEWIGWKRHSRIKRLPLVIANKRFLIFPWVNVPNLASKALSLIAGQVAGDWQESHGASPVLIETFIDPSKFSGACYQAANWQFVGQTNPCSQYKGNRGEASAKDIYVYPLDRDFREVLNGKKPWPPRAETTPTTILMRQSLSGEDQAFATLWIKVTTAVSEIARAFDEKWQRRSRVVDSLMLVLLIFRLIASKDRRGYGSVIDELWENCGRVKIALPQPEGIANSSFSVARRKLDEQIFKDINTRIVAIYEEEHGEEHLWFGRRVFAVDGTKVNLPRELLKKGYRRPQPLSHYPQGTGSCLYNVNTMMPHDFGLYNHRDERRCAREHFKVMTPRDVVVYDRGYFSYHMLHRHLETGIDAIFRLKKNQWTEVIAFWKNKNETDKVVTLLPEGQTLYKILKVNPRLEIKALKMRLIKYRIEGKSYMLGTTLLDSIISASDFQNAYHQRWKIEELYKISKQTFAIEQFHGRTERGVKQEWNAHFTVITMNMVIAQHADRTRRFPKPPPHQLPAPRVPARRQTNFKNTVGNFYRNIESLIIRGASLFFDAVGAVLTFSRKRFHRVRPGRKFPRRSFKAIGKWVPTPPKPSARRVTAYAR